MVLLSAALMFVKVYLAEKIKIDKYSNKYK